ncbi:hypothetical protein KFK09_000537 [Dendrobium nobile]|uniref:Uncharacterized protein n=1 Tax=Dendrobium nobile TaxID=94219 RepID=A0A8T3C8X6_DENNO|nr:hypothetical protein KFK09_000537 [Dendrobium nobile]
MVVRHAKLYGPARFWRGSFHDQFFQALAVSLIPRFSFLPHASKQPLPPLLPPSKQKEEEDGLFKDPATFSHSAKEET